MQVTSPLPLPEIWCSSKFPKTPILKTNGNAGSSTISKTEIKATRLQECRNQMETWVEHIRVFHLIRGEVWVALNTTITTRKSAYPPPALSLSPKTNVNTTLHPFLKWAYPKLSYHLKHLGLCDTYCNTPMSMTGFGMTDLYNLQCCSWVEHLGLITYGLVALWAPSLG